MPSYIRYKAQDALFIRYKAKNALSLSCTYMAKDVYILYKTAGSLL